MGVYIKGVNYPESCIDCTFLGEDWDDEDTYIVAYCGATDDYREIYDSRKDNRTHEEVVTRKPDWCPLVALPDHHGRLVEFIDVVKTLDEDSGTEEVCFGDIMRAYYEMRNAPTIVEAEDSE